MPDEARGRPGAAAAPPLSRGLLGAEGRAPEAEAEAGAEARAASSSAPGPAARGFCAATGSTNAVTCADEVAAAGDGKGGAGLQANWSKFWTSMLLGGREQLAIALALLATALLLVCVPCAYCWLDQGRADLADSYRAGAHKAGDGTCYSCQAAPDRHHVPVLHIGQAYMDEVMSGGINGLLMMVATVLAGIGADIPGRGVFAMGSASLAAYSFSMGFGAFVVESAKNEFSLSQLREEYQEVRDKPDDEISEMVCHYRKRGISEEDARVVAGVLSKYEDFWVQHMMAEELGIQLPRGGSPALSSGLATSASFLFFGTIPLLGVILSIALGRFSGPQWYRPQFSTLVALALSATALVLLGTSLGKAVGSRSPLANGLLILANGCVASVLALCLSKAYSRFSWCCSTQAGKSVTTPSECLQTSSRSPTSLNTPLPSVSASADDVAWPTFRRRFFYGLCVLWVGVCTVIVCMQCLERMVYDSLRVFLYGGLTCITTGLGALPFAFVKADAIGEGPMAIANAVAGGMMLSASVGMVWEAHDHCGPMDWQIFVGIIAGGLFIKASERLHGSDEEEDDVLALHNAFIERRHLRKAMLIFTVMFCHSAAEGIAVGVAFSKQLSEQFGLYVSLLLAVHNVPEGLAVALVLVPRGVSVTLASVIATLTSVPQPLLALAAFLFVDAFRWLLPLGLTFASGAMVYVCLHELLQDAAGQMGWRRALQVTTVSFIVMSVTIAVLHAHSGL